MPDTKRCRGRWPSADASSSGAGDRRGRKAWGGTQQRAAGVAAWAGRDRRVGVHTLHTLHSTCAAAVHPCAAEVAQLWSEVPRAPCVAAAAGGGSCAHLLGSRTHSPCSPAARWTAGQQSWWGLQAAGGGPRSRLAAWQRLAPHASTAAPAQPQPVRPAAKCRSRQQPALVPCLACTHGQGHGCTSSTAGSSATSVVQATICGRAVAGSTHLRRWCCAQTAPPAAPPAAGRGVGDCGAPGAEQPAARLGQGSKRGSPPQGWPVGAVAHQQQAVVPCKRRLIIGERLAVGHRPGRCLASALDFATR